jgi:glycine/D-amino acid oxidase-like deaminating enzyme
MECDILVIGAGVLGLSAAYHLKRSDPAKKIVVIDMYGGPGQGNSAKSTGGFRNVFSSETNFLLANSTIDFFSHLENIGYDLKLAKIGYLWLLSRRQHRNIKNMLNKIEKRGTEINIFEKEAIRERLPDLAEFSDDDEVELMNLEEVETGLLGKKCGILDADALVRSYEQEFLKIGGIVHYNLQAEKLILKPEMELEIQGEPFVWQDAYIAGAETNGGEIFAETTVAALGAWSENLFDPIGIDSHMRPKKRQLFSLKDDKLERLFRVKGLNEYKIMPLTILPKSSIFFKPEISEGSIWVGCADNLGRSYGIIDDPEAEEDFYTNDIYHVLTKYFPCFKDIRPTNMWAGHYAINGFDDIPVVTPNSGLIYVGAASGSGIMKSDALGRIVSAIYSKEEEAELYGGVRLRVDDLGIESRRVEKESLII